MKWNRRVVGEKTIGYIDPWSCSDHRMTEIECLKAESDEVIVRVGDIVYSTSDKGSLHLISAALVQLIDSIVEEDPNSSWTGRLGDYCFTNGLVVEGGDGFRIS